MLEEIRVKMMKRVGQMRKFCDSWIHDFSPMALKVLTDHTARSMKCSIEWNSDTGYEILEGQFRHVVDLPRQTCSCRAWMLKGIPCPHAIAAFHHKKLNPMDYISQWYSRDTYMKIYSHFIQPVLNLKIWPPSTNPTVIPPKVRNMHVPGRPKITGGRKQMNL
ncbi:uncharacterized protein LOC132038542 [Lycium ferocissimum]|uniref:uncharacterized protein LOC132038542 n=1 Tax=Lycium ferocissimum TaxID=112874 RepID=UPI0028154EA2|nr:uncharacterized protein LOC132038542 [Lycium ferocissimum]